MKAADLSRWIKRSTLQHTSAGYRSLLAFPESRHQSVLQFAQHIVGRTC